MQKVAPCLWFDKNAEEAMSYYVSTFPDSKIVSIKYYPKNATDEHMQGMDGKVLTGIFELNNQRFMALDGGPLFKFNEAISFVINCKDQEEIDYFWEKLSAVPQSEQCGWCKDKFGISWQIIPQNMGELLKSDKALAVMLKMHKINIKELEEAAKE